LSERTEDSGLTYRSAGVDIDAQDRALSRIRSLVEGTKTEHVLSELGSFGGLFSLPEGIERPVLVSSVDGVGTKVMVAQAASRHDSVGHDLVNHCVNDILVMGARPLFFLDYFAVGRLDPSVAEGVVSGVAAGCRENGIALVGGETAEMPDVYSEESYDLAGTIVGVAPRASLLEPGRAQPGDLLVGLPSSGLHTNGYTLARRIVFDVMQLGPDDELPGCGRSVADELLAVHRSYLGCLMPLVEDGLVKGLAHITGGGLVDNVPRVLARGTVASIRLGSWPVPPVFGALQRAGDVPDDDMMRTFNMGLGMVVVVDQARRDELLQRLGRAGEPELVIGRIESAGDESAGPRVAFTSTGA